MTLLSRGEPSVFECVLRIQTTLASVTWPFTVLSVPLLMPTLPLRSGETCGDLLNFSGPQFLTCKISVMLLTSQGEGTTHRAGRPRHTALLCVSPLEGEFCLRSSGHGSFLKALLFLHHWPAPDIG